MKVLYGSQNFGFDTKDSDFDYMEIVLPSWKDILIGGMESKTIINSHGLTKRLDMRKYVKCLMKGGFSDLQTLYAKQYDDAENLKWFIDNRDRIVHMDLMTLYDTNRGCMSSMLKRKEFRSKDLTHLYVFNQLLHKVIEDKEFDVYNPEFLDYRTHVSNWKPDKIKKESDLIIKDTEELKSRYELLYTGKDLGIENEMWEETTRILLTHMNKLGIKTNY